MSPGYWAGTLNVASADAGLQTKIKLQRDLENVIEDNFGCSNSANSIECSYDQIHVQANNSGSVTSWKQLRYCVVSYDGIAKCYAQQEQ